MQNISKIEPILEFEHPRVEACKEDGLVGSKRVHVLEISDFDKDDHSFVTGNELTMVHVYLPSRGWKKVPRKNGKKEKLSDYYNT